MATPGEEGGGEEGEPTDTLDPMIAKAQVALAAHGVNEPVAVYLAIDRSDPALCNGDHCELTAKRVTAFAVACGVSVVPASLFSTAIDAVFPLTPIAWSGVVAAQNSGLSGVISGVLYEPVVTWVNEHYTDSLSEIPAFVVVDTNGNPDDLFETDLAMTWSVAGWDLIGRGSVTESMATLDANWDFVSALPTQDGLTDELVFDHLASALAAALSSSS